MCKKTISKTCLMTVAILLIGACWQASAQSGEIKSIKGYEVFDTNDIQPRTWADLPADANGVLIELILGDENSVLLPPGDGPSGLPSELQWVGGMGHNNIVGNTKLDVFGLAHFHFPTLTLYLWEYQVWTSDDGDKLFTTNTLILDAATHTLSGTKTVIGGTGRFEGAVSNPLKAFGGDVNHVGFLTLEGWIYLDGPSGEAAAN